MLLVTLALLLSGAAGFAHERFDHHHHDALAESSHVHHDGPAEPHAPPPPDEHGDCPTCHLLLTAHASSLDLAAAPAFDTASTLAPTPATDPAISRDATRLPPGRGPPTLPL